MPISQERKSQEIVDAEHLKLLGIFHFVLAGISALMSCFFIIHIVMGWNMINNTGMFGSTQNAPPAEAGWLFLGVGSVFMLVGFIYSLLVGIAGMFLHKRKHRMFVLITACLNCCNMPLGLILGIFTFMVMQRPSVRELFAQDVAPPAVMPNFASVLPDPLAASEDPDEAIWKELEAKAKSTLTDESTNQEAEPQVIKLKEADLAEESIEFYGGA